MIIDLLLTLDYDPETKTVSIVKQKVTGEKESTTKKKSTKKKDDGSTVPIIYLEDNKLSLNNRAMEVLELEPDERVSIIYQTDDEGYLFPVIAKDSTLGCEGGNRTTKSQTVSCRGKANEKLREFGSEFTLVDIGQGLFKMDGGVKVKASSKTKPDNSIKISKEEDIEEDLPMEATLDESDNTEINEEFNFEL